LTSDSSPRATCSLVLAELLGESPDAVPVILDHPVIHHRFIERREVLALEVLDDGDLECGLVVDLLDECGDRLEPGGPRRSPSPLPRDELVARGPDGADEDGLEHAMLADRGRELLQRILIELHARLLRVRLDPVERDDADPLGSTRILGRQQADDGRGELSVLRQSASGDGAEVSPSQDRSPPVPGRGTRGLHPSCPRTR
jgi:hypothetical protein